MGVALFSLTTGPTSVDFPDLGLELSFAFFSWFSFLAALTVGSLASGGAFGVGATAVVFLGAFFLA